MTDTADLPQDLIDRGLQLSPEAKRKFAALLWESADVGDPDLRAELTRRWERYQDGTDPSHAAEDVIAELRARAERRKP
jgi:hypothetical protein